MAAKKPGECTHDLIERDFERMGVEAEIYVARCLDCGKAVSVLTDPVIFQDIVDKLNKIEMAVVTLLSRD
jgi:indole-3-glycerol phosphate synthase